MGNSDEPDEPDDFFADERECLNLNVASGIAVDANPFAEDLGVVGNEDLIFCSEREGVHLHDDIVMAPAPAPGKPVEEDLSDGLFGPDDDVVELGGTVLRGGRRYCCLGCYNRGIGSKVYTELWQCYSCGLDLRARRGPGTEGIAGSQCLPKPT